MGKLANWMSHLDDSRKLVDLCLPESHDAGVYRDQPVGINPGSKTCRQASDIWKQSLAGSRVFEVRCFLRTTGGFKKTETPTMGHFLKEGRDGYLGEYGGTLISALEDASMFLENNATEFLIFRIGHTKCTGNVAEALEEFRKAKGKSVIHTGATGNLADLEVRDLRGKLILVFDQEFNSNFDPKKAAGYYPY